MNYGFKTMLNCTNTCINPILGNFNFLKNIHMSVKLFE